MSDALNPQALASRVDAELRDIVDARDFPLYRMMSYHMGWRDAAGQPAPHAPPADRARGVLTLMAFAAAAATTPSDAPNAPDGDGIAPDINICLPAAAAVELVDKFTEIHDDIQEGSPQRNARDAVWWTWGPAQAINAGDGMHALGRLALFRLLDRGVDPDLVFRAVQIMDEAALKTCEGRFRDLEAQERIDLSVDASIAIAADKTGALISAAMQLGAAIANAPDAAVAALGECGKNLGVAIQIRADINAIWRAPDPESPAPAVMNKKKLIPVVCAIENAAIRQKRQLGDIYFKRVLDPEDAQKLRALLETLNARQQSETLAAAHAAAAIAALNRAPSIPPQSAAPLATQITTLTQPPTPTE